MDNGTTTLPSLRREALQHDSSVTSNPDLSIRDFVPNPLPTCQDAQARVTSAEEAIPSPSTCKDDDDDDDDDDNEGSQSFLQQTTRHSMPIRLSSLPKSTSVDNPPPLNTANQPPSIPTPSPSQKPVQWRDLPHKRQLLILVLARLSEPLAQTSLQAYIFYQLRSFNPSLPDSTIASQVGLLQGCFTGSQFMTAMMWGRLSDSERWGRKKVIVIGLLGAGVSCVGMGFSRNVGGVMGWRVVGGVVNGNVGVLRTMVSEIVAERRLRERAFLLLPMCFNVGVIVGPVLGGLLADPVASYPRVFGDNSVLGGKDGVWWLKHWPYALPNLMSAVFVFSATVAVLFGLEETLESISDQPDQFINLGRSIANTFRRIFYRHPHHQYTALDTNDDDTPLSSAQSHDEAYELEPCLPSMSNPQRPKKPHRPPPPLRSILTPNVLTTLLSHFLLAFHLSTFNSLWFIFLSTPRSPQPARNHDHPVLFFTGGLALPPRTIGLALAILGFTGLTLQLAFYPYLTSRFGTLTSWRCALLCFPLAYTLVPYLAIVPTSHLAPHPADGPWIWMSMLGVLAVQVLGRTFALPAMIILVNNCSPSKRVLGTVHGVAQSVSSAARTIGPVVGAWGFGKGLDGGVVGAVWWGLAGWAVVGFVVGRGVVEGKGLYQEVEGMEEDDGDDGGRDMPRIEEEAEGEKEPRGEGVGGDFSDDIGGSGRGQGTRRRVGGE